MIGPGRAVGIGLLIPATNSVAEHEFNEMRPSTVSLHATRYDVGDARMDSPTAITALLEASDASIPAAVRLLAGINAKRLIHVMSAHSFRLEAGEAAQVARDLKRESGLSVTDAPMAFAAALGVLNAHRVAVLTPYHPAVEAAVVAGLENSGVHVVARSSLNASSTRSVAAIGRAAIIDAVEPLAGSRPDAIVQIGGNLPFAQLAAAAEKWLGIPVLAANTTLLWHALRSEEMTERVPAWGCLLEEY